MRGQGARDDIRGTFGVSVVHVEVGNKPHGVRAFVEAEHAVCREQLGDLGGAQAGGARVGEHHVGLDRSKVHGEPGRPGDALRENAAPAMVVGEARNVVPQSVQTAGRDDSGLPHPATQQLAGSGGPPDPTRTEPTGAPSPFERQTLTESKGAAISAGGSPLATAALQTLAPSR